MRNLISFDEVGKCTIEELIEYVFSYWGAAAICEELAKHMQKLAPKLESQEWSDLAERDAIILKRCAEDLRFNQL